MRNIIIVLSALTLLASCGGRGGHHGGHAGHGGGWSARSTGSLVEWYRLAPGKETAWILEKPMLVDFFVPEGCDRCERMDRDLWGNPEIARLVNESFVPVRIDLSRNLTREEIALGRTYDYNYDCLLLFLDHRGEVIEDAGGGRMCFADFVSTEWFLGHLEHALAATSR
ncbi:MAG: thioredoxin family protein [Deferrisomatales bacterium]|nr:thioredoxin family protein [Deferrisomatales bacterium]